MMDVDLERDINPRSYGTCRGSKCGARILWADTAGGKMIPLNPKPTQSGNVELVAITEGWRRPVVKVHGEAPLLVDGPLFMPHHATCPSVDEFREKDR